MISGSALQRSLTAIGLTAVLAIPGAVEAQDCEGNEPGGGMWASSGELYLDRARRNPNPQDKQNLYRQAVEILTEGFAEQPDNPRNFLMAGEAYVGLNDYRMADSVWTVAEDMWSCYQGRIDTLRFNAWANAFNRGVQYANNNDVEQALEHYRHAETIYDKQPQSALQLGSIFARRAQTAPTDSADMLRDQAIEHFRDAIDAVNASQRLSDEDRAELGQAATFNLAQLLAMEGRYDEAAQAFDRFLEQEPDNVTARTNLAVVLTQGADALDDSASFLEDSTAVAELEQRVDSLESVAREQYVQLVELEGLSAGDYHNIGIGLQRVDAPEEAITAFEKALQAEPYRAGSLEQLGLALFNAERYDTLLTVAETLVERYPNNMNSLAILANTYRELERREDALATLEQREALAFEMLNVEMTGEQGSYVIAGHMSNRTLEPGTPIQVEFDLRSPDGEVVASTMLEATAGEQDVPQQFSVQAQSTDPVAGFTYSVVEPPAATDGEPSGS